jgi:hypothetical protein
VAASHIGNRSSAAAHIARQTKEQTVTDLEPTNEPGPGYIEIREQDGGFVICYDGDVMSRVFDTPAEAEAWRNDLPF